MKTLNSTGASSFPIEVIFLTNLGKGDLKRLELNLRAEINADLIQPYRGFVALPFEAGEHGPVAVKIIDDRGIESLKIVELQ